MRENWQDRSIAILGLVIGRDGAANRTMAEFFDLSHHRVHQLPLGGSLAQLAELRPIAAQNRRIWRIAPVGCSLLESGMGWGRFTAQPPWHV